MMIRKPRNACARLQRRPHQCRSASRLVTLASLLLALLMPVGVVAESGRSNQSAHEQANQRLRKVCKVEAFLGCMRWDAPSCDRNVDEAIQIGRQLGDQHVARLAPRHRSNEQIVSGLYLGGTLGALLKNSGPRLNNCLPDPRTLSD